MAEENTKSVGRPRIPIDAIEVERLASLGCKVVEIAALLGCSDQTLFRNFETELTKGRENLRMSLRQMQIKSAQNGNVAMLIWLGKQYLDQRDQATLQLEKIPDEMLVAEAQRRLTNGSKS